MTASRTTQPPRLTEAQLAALKKSVSYNRDYLGLSYYESPLEIVILEALIVEVEAARKFRRPHNIAPEIVEEHEFLAALSNPRKAQCGAKRKAKQ